MIQVLIFSVIIPLILMLLGMHKIDEGYIGLYSRGGRLLDGYTESGLNVAIPILTKIHPVQITVQTDIVTNIPCGTSGGVTIKFDNIEVVNRLRKDYAWETVKNYTVDYDKTWIFDKIHHEINQYCSKHTLQEIYITKFDKIGHLLAKALSEGCAEWAPGIEIIDVRASKPRIPEGVMENYIEMEVEKANLLLSSESQKVSRILAKTEISKATMNAEIESKMQGVESKANKMRKNNDKAISDITQKIVQEHSSMLNKIQLKRNKVEQKINNKKLAEQFIKYSIYQKYNSVPKSYYVKDPNSYLDL